MAALNFCCCSNLSPLPNLTTSLSHRQNSHSLTASSPLASCSPPQVTQFRSNLSSICDSFSKASVLALVSASLVFASNPALAFKGGGPYGVEVTRGQDLTGKDFSGKTLIKQDFKTSILRQANFKGAKLLGASFFDADLTGADLSDADLRGADFSLANVTKVNLSNANLEGALTTGNTSFKGSIITGADFTDVPLRDDQRELLCKVADGTNPVTGNETRETLLCK
ncbi:thylakoid lumenal 15 kDa protein 1, chloroplastic-like [Salvia splendens]|uniref:thylakoid lumenal 15 kDa protein 1, chloroplastic-like n=1 Tax=Salvia splendens TaxID=180675 RepID=UPI0011040AAB|nr:thylakoid lumenal 15 kDa protein 1, chloroplastic-like [Salvia splendens]